MLPQLNGIYVPCRIVVVWWDHLGIVPLTSCGWELVNIFSFSNKMSIICDGIILLNFLLKFSFKGL